MAYSNRTQQKSRRAAGVARLRAVVLRQGGRGKEASYSATGLLLLFRHRLNLFRGRSRRSIGGGMAEVRLCIRQRWWNVYWIAIFSPVGDLADNVH